MTCTFGYKCVYSFSAYSIEIIRDYIDPRKVVNEDMLHVVKYYYTLDEKSKVMCNNE